MINNTGERREGYCIVAVNLIDNKTDYVNLLWIKDEELTIKGVFKYIMKATEIFNEYVSTNKYDFVYVVNLYTRRLIKKYSRLDEEYIIP